MPTISNTPELKANSSDVMNAIRNEATAEYQSVVPLTNGTLESIREVGSIIMSYQATKNEFIDAVNRIGLVLVTSKSYQNPWAMFKRGLLEFGETVEEIFVNIAEPHEYDVELSEKEVFKRELPDVRSAFHVLNYKKFYKVTIQENDLRQAFLSWNGVTNLINKIKDSLYTAMNYDEFLTMKYMIAKAIINGYMYVAESPAITTGTTAEYKAVTASIKSLSNKLGFMSSEYNYNNVETMTEKSNQYLIVNSDFDANMDVEVLAAAFNMDKVEFVGHKVLVDSFGELNTKRLNKLFAKDPNYTPISDIDLALIKKIPGVLVDSDWFMIFDNLFQFTSQYNGEGLYWNYWLHTWKTFSISPFANAIVLSSGKPAVTSVTVTPATVTLKAGDSIQLSVTVVTTNFGQKDVIWSSSNEDVATVTQAGYVKIKKNATGTVTITATSDLDNSKTGTCVITISTT